MVGSLQARRGLATVLAAAALAGVGGIAWSDPTSATPAAARHGDDRHGDDRHHTDTGCDLGNGVQHVIHITFDNVHFFRDNPAVPSDLEQMPTLLNFLRENGTVLSNMHTPLIAHTAEDSLAIYTGLYGDRHGMPVSNSYKTYQPDGTTNPAGSFAYWTSPVYDTSTHAPSTTDHSPTMVYADPAHPAADGRTTPAPWVPFTRAGCTVGDFSTANMVLENVGVDLPTVFGPASAEAKQLAADSAGAPYYNAEVADYVGVAVHCAHGDATCADARGVKFGGTAATPTATTDALPDEPGGYHGYQALFGARYVAPQLGAGTADVTSHGYPVTDAHGTLTDLDGNPIVEPYSHKPGFPGFSPTASQTLAYLADMQEAGIPVTYGYISDIHEKKYGQTGCTSNPASRSGATGPGDPCTAQTAAAYDQAFKKFLDRLARDGITPANTVFVIGSEENDHFAGANAGRANTPSCTGATCSYAANQIGELQVGLPNLLATQRGNTTAVDVEPQGAAMYVHGTAAAPRPAANDPAVRQLERDTAALTADNPYSGVTGERIVNYQAGAVAQKILHLTTADPLRTPTYTIFPKPDYYFCQSCTGVSINNHYAWNHGYYSPDIDITWSAFVGPNVKAGGVDGPDAQHGPAVTDPNGAGTVPQYSTRGTWADETDIRPTLMALVGLRDDYRTDGRVITEILRRVPSGLAGTEQLGAMLKQLDASVGEFGTAALQADTAALASGNASDDRVFTRTEAALTRLGARRDALVLAIQHTLAQAAGERERPDRHVVRQQLAAGRALLVQVQQLARQAEHGHR